ncbi:hypothetical protein [Streptomyces lydicamycinicus]|uniref:hypothetical protein n=1 Tax=Streptomyces lydicamycinicus TaxID=1546107 RepID=UPI003D802B4D
MRTASGEAGSAEDTEAVTASREGSGAGAAGRALGVKAEGAGPALWAGGAGAALPMGAPVARADWCTGSGSWPRTDARSQVGRPPRAG